MKTKTILLAASLICATMAGAPNAHAQTNAKLPPIGEWDGVTQTAKLDRPYEDPNQTPPPFGIISYFNHPWRAFMDTWPASQWQHLGGAGWNIDAKYADPMAQILSESGIRTLRVEFGWGNLNWNDDYDEGRKAQIKAQFAAFKKYGIRPMVLLNAHHGVPCPMKYPNVELMADAKKGDRIVKLKPGTQVKENYTGFPHPDYIAAYPFITKVDEDGTAHLSAPLGQDFKAGNTQVQELKYRPFQGIALKDATPEENARVAAEAEATAQGWLKYVEATANLAREALGTQGQADAGFDMEVWNEQTFGANFLNINNYYDPPLQYTQPFVYKKTRAFKPGMRPDARLEFSQEGAYAILPMTIDWINERAKEYPGVRVVSGFANQWPWDSGTALWDGQAGFSRHYYTGGYFDVSAEKPIQKGVGSIDALGNFDGQRDNKDWHTIVPGTNFVPTVRIGSPEWLHFGFKTESLVRDVWPDSRTSFMGGVWDRHGRYTHNGDYKIAELWQTEVNYDRSFLFSELQKEGFKADDPKMLALDEYFAGKYALRQYIFHNAKGLKRIYLFALGVNPYSLGMFSQKFYDTLDKANLKVTPEVRAAIPPEFQGLAWFTKQMDTAQNITTTRALRVDELIEHKPRLVYAGDGTAAHPHKWNRDIFAFLPYQTAANKFVIPYYVPTLDVNRVQDATRDKLDPKRYEMPPQDFDVTIGNCEGQGAKVSVYDPLTNTNVPVAVLGRAANTLKVRLKTVDYPRVLVVEEAKPGILITDAKVAVNADGVATVNWKSNLPAGAVKLTWGRDWQNRGANEVTVAGGKNAYEVKIPTGIKDVVAVRVRVAANGLTTDWPRWDEEPAGQAVNPSAPPVPRDAPPQGNAPEMKAENAVAFDAPAGIALPVAATLRGINFNVPQSAKLNGGDEQETNFGATGKSIQLRVRYIANGAAHMNDNLPFSATIDTVSRRVVKLPSGALAYAADYQMAATAHPGMTNLNQRFLLVPTGTNNTDLLVLSATGTPEAMTANDKTISALFASVALPPPAK